MLHSDDSLLSIDVPVICAEVLSVYHAYEAALVRNDVDVLNDFFWRSSRTVRHGVAEQSYGYDAICAYRRDAPAVDPTRKLCNTVVTTFGRDFASVCTEFSTANRTYLGRQTQTWVRFPEGWKIVAAHISHIEL